MPEQENRDSDVELAKDLLEQLHEDIRDGRPLGNIEAKAGRAYMTLGGDPSEL